MINEKQFDSGRNPAERRCALYRHDQPFAYQPVQPASKGLRLLASAAPLPQNAGGSILGMSSTPERLCPEGSNSSWDTWIFLALIILVIVVEFCTVETLVSMVRKEDFKFGVHASVLKGDVTVTM